MPPPDPCHKVSTRSTVDNETESEIIGDCNNSKANSKESVALENANSEVKGDSVSIVKLLLGPSLEDAVLRTLEFGKSLIQPKDELETIASERKMQKQVTKDTKDKGDDRDHHDSQDQDKDLKCDKLGERTTKKRIVFTAKLDKDTSNCGKTPSSKKPGSLSKIRSLDSDLKQAAPSPEKIKRQLEALIQINKDEPPEAPWSVYPNKTPKIPMNVTVMPTMCVYRNEANFNCPSSCEVQPSRKMTSEFESGSTSKLQRRSGSRRRLGAPCPISQAPEFISNALGPTLDVSIIDNLKMMRNLFKCDSTKGDSKSSEATATAAPSSQIHSKADKKGSECSNLTHISKDHQQTSRAKSEEEMKRKICELERRIEELQQKEVCLLDRIEEEEKERECKRRAFEEERKLRAACMEEAEKNRREMRDMKDIRDMSEYDAKYENLKQRICCEEEKLSRLKDQYECYKREIAEAKSKKEALKRNKSLLDAWDVIASRVCHTRLPSFSRAYNLERKQMKGNDPAAIHCCFQGNDEPPKRRSRSRSRSPCANRCKSQSQGLLKSCCRSKESCKQTSPTDCHSGVRHFDNVPFPIQRDVICGLHQILKKCNCSEPVRVDPMTSTSDDELFKKCAEAREGKPVCRSRSDTTMKNKCTKIVKVMWAITRINIFQDNCRTYEVMNATTNPPACTSGKTEGIFVVKNPKSSQPGTSRRRSHHKERC